MQCPNTGVFWWGRPASKAFIGIFYNNNHTPHKGWFRPSYWDRNIYVPASFIDSFSEIDYSLLDVELMPLPEILYKKPDDHTSSP